MLQLYVYAVGPTDNNLHDILRECSQTAGVHAKPAVLLIRATPYREDCDNSLADILAFMKQGIYL